MKTKEIRDKLIIAYKKVESLREDKPDYSKMDNIINEVSREAFKTGMSINVRGLTEEFKDKCFNNWLKKQVE